MLSLFVVVALSVAGVAFAVGFHCGARHPLGLTEPPPDLQVVIEGQEEPVLYTPALMDHLALLERHIARLESRSIIWSARLVLSVAIIALVALIVVGSVR